MSKKILLLTGKKSFSDSRIEQLQNSLNKINKTNLEVQVNDFYFLYGDIKEKSLDRINLILESNSHSENFSFFIGPRKGTISPWASKTSDILKNISITDIDSIEKFYAYSIKNNTDDSLLDLSSLYDRMTQSIYQDIEVIKKFKDTEPTRVLKTFDILNLGISELKKANQEFGFAMSDEEIDYLFNFYNKENRNPTDAELMMFAQANSEHCRHKIFNAKWSINGNQKNSSLFDLIKETSKKSPDGIISAYKDNAAIVEGFQSERLSSSRESYKFVEEKLNATIKVETHNHPTAISPYPGAATGSGGEIRDEGATGIGAKPKIGLVGFNVSNLRLPNIKKTWEGPERKPSRIASPLEIMVEAPIGAAAFNNEFGRPSTLGYFRSLETKFDISNNAIGYHKPIMLAGGVGEIRDANNFKLKINENYLVVVLGGPSMLIGLGGGAASSVSSGDSDEDLDFASVQRDNAEMERRCQEVINTCSSMDKSLIEFIHDVGAGGLSNAIPELAKDSGLGVEINLQKIPCSDSSMSPMEIWSNESQERYVLAIHKNNEADFAYICNRERCPFAIVGTMTKEKFIKLIDKGLHTDPVNVPLSMLFGNLPIKDINIGNVKKGYSVADEINVNSFKNVFHKVLRHPTVSCKSFLITIGDRTVGGMVARDQFIGPYQIPVSDYSLSLSSFLDNSGEVLSIGEKPTIAITNPAASMRMAIGEALTNMSGTIIRGLNYVQVSANWMAPTETEIENLNLREGVEALSKSCVDLGISVPVGKDSLSMKTKWNDGNNEYSVASPLSGVITAMCPVSDVRKSITPELHDEKDSKLIYLSHTNKKRLMGSIFSEVEELNLGETPDIDDISLFKSFFLRIQDCVLNGKILALHDVSDGGMITSIVEMCFTKRIGVNINIDSEKAYHELFAEELGVVVQVKKEYVASLLEDFNKNQLFAKTIADLRSDEIFVISHKDKNIYEENIRDIEQIWRETSYTIQSLRDNKMIADSELELIKNENHKGLFYKHNFKQPSNQINIKGSKPKVAILREQGVNGQMEMAAAFTIAGFKAVDVHMQDLLDGNTKLSNFNGLAICGGFSYGDVLGAGGGWSKTILFNERIKEQFRNFFNDNKTFTLGVCNGCQMVSNLRDIIPGAENWPSFKKNLSDQFEARLVQAKIEKTNSILLRGMQGWSIPIASSHGEGRAEYSNNFIDKSHVALRYVDSNNDLTEKYPLNPNGSPEGVAGVTAADGRVTIMMPHPERVFRNLQLSWRESNDEFSPWMKIFINAKTFSEEV